MCFINNPENLAKVRSRKRSIIAWKTSRHYSLASNQAFTGLRCSGCITLWKEGETIVPDVSLPVARGRKRMSHGLYAYLHRPTPAFWEVLIKLSIRPKDVIGVGEQNKGFTLCRRSAPILCCCAARVLKIFPPGKTPTPRRPKK